jgi:RNA polymerase sigma-70 factor
MVALSFGLEMLLRDTQWAPLLPDIQVALARVQPFDADADTARAVYQPNFVHHLLGHIQVAPDMKAALAAVHVTDLYLAFACLEHKPAAVRSLEARYLAPLEQLFLRKNASAWTKDVSQMLRAKLLVGLGGAAPALAAYAGRGPLAPWLKVTATRVLLNDIRATPRRASAADDELGILMDTSPNPRTRLSAPLLRCRI